MTRGDPNSIIGMSQRGMSPQEISAYITQTRGRPPTQSEADTIRIAAQNLKAQAEREAAENKAAEARYAQLEAEDRALSQALRARSENLFKTRAAQDAALAQERAKFAADKANIRTPAEKSEYGRLVSAADKARVSGVPRDQAEADLNKFFAKNEAKYKNLAQNGSASQNLSGAVSIDPFTYKAPTRTTSAITSASQGQNLSQAAKGLSNNLVDNPFTNEISAEDLQKALDALNQSQDGSQFQYKKGGQVRKKAKPKAPVKAYAKGGKVSSASKRGDGCAMRGKTKGRMI